MEREAATAAAPAPAKAPVVPAAVGGAPIGAGQVLSLQRTAGNQAVCRAIATGSIQRDDAAPAVAGQPSAGAEPAAAGDVTGITVTPQKARIPLEAGVMITAAARPAGLAGVVYSLSAGSTSPAAGTSIDAGTGTPSSRAAAEGHRDGAEHVVLRGPV